MTLTDFLLARIAEDEAVAEFWADMWTEGNRFHAQFNPPRMLTECEAKRRIVTAAIDDSPIGNWMSALTLEWALSTLALPYADHPDYRQEWKP